MQGFMYQRSRRLLKGILYGEILKVNRIVLTDFQHKQLYPFSFSASGLLLKYF